MLRVGRYGVQFQTEAKNVFLLQTSRPSLGSTYLPVQWVHLPSFSVGPSTFLLNGSIYFPIQGTPEKARRAIKYIPASSGEWRLNSTPPPPRAVTSCTARASRSRNQTTQQTNLTKKIKRRRGSHITSS